MKIWLINQYNMPPEYGHLNRHFNFGKYLKRMGHEPTVFVGSFLHNTKIQMIEDDSLIRRYENADYPYYFIKTCDYSSSKLKRIYAMYEFYKNLLKEVKSFDKPDAILGSSAHPLAAVAAIKLARKFDCQSIVEVRDLWPESFVAYGIVSRKNPLLRLLYTGERWIYKSADKLVFTMEGGKDYIIERGWNLEQGGSIDINKVHHINNGVDLEVFNYNKEHYQFDDDDLDDPNTFKVIYTGSIRLVNKVDTILDVAKLVYDKNIKFLIWGTGDQLDRLKKRVIDEKITNVNFKGWIDKKYIPFILSRAQLNISLGDIKTLFRYGISPNKMFDYFAAEKPCLWTFKSNYSLVNKYNTGIEMSVKCAEEIAGKIMYFKEMSKDDYMAYCYNSEKAAKDYDFNKLTNSLIKIIQD